MVVRSTRASEKLDAAAQGGREIRVSGIGFLGDDLDRVGHLFSGESQPGERVPKLISPRRNGGHPVDSSGR